MAWFPATFQVKNSPLPLPGRAGLSYVLVPDMDTQSFPFTVIKNGAGVSLKVEQKLGWVLNR